MKKLIAGLFTIAAFTFSAVAQEQTHDHRKMHKEKHGMHKGHEGKGFDQLNLTEAQRQQMKTINEEFRTRMQTLQKNDNIVVKEQKEQRKALMEERKNRIAAILTPEQRTQFEQMHKERGHKEHGVKGERKGEWKTKTKGEDWKQKRKVEDGEEKIKIKS